MRPFRGGRASSCVLLVVIGCGTSDTGGGSSTPASGGASGASGVGGVSAGGAGLSTGGGGIAGTTSTSSGGAGGSGGPDGCLAFLQAQCAQELACSPIDFHFAWFDTVQACVDRLMPVCALELAAPGTSASTATLTACAAAMSRQTCAEALTAAAPECLLPGTLPNGTGCEFSSQCQSSFCSTTSNDPNPCGTCQPRVGVGGRCEQRGDLRFEACDRGLVCTSAGCAQPVPKGGSCSRLIDHQCAPPLVCLQGSCSEAIPVGSACYDRDQCAGDAYCQNLNTGGLLIGSICTALIYAPPGAVCDTGRWCSAGSNCKDASGMYASVGTCVAVAPDGTTCTAGSDCTIPATCSNGICKGLPPASSCP
jgi:hypothetical protein